MSYKNHYDSYDNEFVDMSDGYNNQPDYGYDTHPDNSYNNNDGDDGSGCGGWVIWIGLLLLINLLSWIFDWSFWVY